MICVTGAERTTDALAARLLAFQRFPLQEVRLDHLDRIDDEAFELLARHPRALIVTCRGRAEGGAFTGTESERAAILRRALELSPAWLDVELSAPAEVRQALFAGRGSTRFILSFHDSAGGRGALRVAETLGAEPADVLKVAVGVHDAANLAPLRRVLAGDGRPVIRIGMGPAGVASRMLYDRFGSPWTYVAADAPVAPGQLGATRAEAWGVGDPARAPLGLLGGAQISGSPGPRVYNALFGRLGLPFLYLPLVTTRPLETLELAESLGFAGLSVTMPGKVALLPKLHVVEPAARALGAVNTIRLRDGHREGFNTDAVALRALLAQCSGERALVLGAGGAARAAIAGLQALGCPVVLTNRTASRAYALGAELGVPTARWAARGEPRFTVLVNATPCGADGRESPMPPGTRWAGRTVLDAVLSPEPTPLVAEAAAGGARTFDGHAWWRAQGAPQITALTGHAVTPEMIAAEMPELTHA